MGLRDRGDDGQSLVEYGLIIFLISGVVLGLLALLGAPIASMFSGITGSI